MACTGACCCTFALDMGKLGPDSDGDFIRDMVVPLAPDQVLPRLLAFGYPVPAAKAGTTCEDLAPDEPPATFFTCRHWDEGTRLCTAYETRPQMCRRFPYAKECHACGGRLDPENDAVVVS